MAMETTPSQPWSDENVASLDVQSKAELIQQLRYCNTRFAERALSGRIDMNAEQLAEQIGLKIIQLLNTQR